MDPRNHWTGRDWAIAVAYFNMLACKPPGKAYGSFYVYITKHKAVTKTRVLKTIREIAAFQKRKLTARDQCIAGKISKLWRQAWK